MESMETTMVNLASPAARRALGRVKERGQTVAENTAHQRRTSTAMTEAAAPMWNRATNGPAKQNSRALSVPMET